MERYIHTDGQQISIADSLSFLQSLQNNNIDNVLRIGLDQIGFLADDFKPFTAQKTSAGQGSANITLKIGAVVFPNGEVFSGQGYNYSIKIERSEFPQYLLMSYQPLRQYEADYADGFNPEERYYMRRDGIKWRLVSGPEYTYQAIDELLVAKIDFPFDTGMTITDLRQKLYPYYGTDILATSEAPSAASLSSDSYYLYPQAMLFLQCNQHSYGPNREALTMLRHSWSPLLIGELRRYYMQVQIAGRQYTDYAIHTSRMPFNITSSYFNLPVFNGVTYDLKIRKIDRNKPTLYTGWVEEGSILGGAVEQTLPCGYPQHAIDTSTLASSIRVVPYMNNWDLSQEMMSKTFTQVWVKDGGRSTQIKTSVDPVTWEIPAINVESATEIPYLPKQCYYPSPASHRVIITSRLVFPGHRCSTPFTTILERNEEYEQCINFGLHYDGDSNGNADIPPGPPWSWNYYQHDCQRWCFTDTSTYYIAVFPCQVSDGYLVSAQFDNHYASASTDIGLLHIEGMGDNFEVEVGTTAAGDYTSNWSEQPIPLVGNTKLYFILEEDAGAPPVGNWINVLGRLRLTFRTGTD